MRIRHVIWVVTLIVLLMATACSDDPPEGDTSGRTTTTAHATTTSTTQPPGTEPQEVQPHVEELLVRLDDVTDSIVRDPQVALDSEHDLVGELTEIFVPESTGLEARTSTYRAQARAGEHLEPVNADQTARTSLTGDIETVDQDTVRFPFCLEMTYRKLAEDGTVIEFVPNLAHPGEGTAARVEGEWRLERIDVFTNTVCTDAEGA